MKKLLYILFLSLFMALGRQTCFAQLAWVELFGETTEVPATVRQAVFTKSLSVFSVQAFIGQIDSVALRPFLSLLLRYKQEQHPDDWLYYQAVRKCAQQISPKAENYYRYTFYKWWLLAHSGYDVMLTCCAGYLLFYVQSDETIYDIPFRTKNGKQYVCLNYHDYGTIDFEKNKFAEVPLVLSAEAKPFSYKVTHLPDFTAAEYTEKKVEFTYGQNQYRFNIKLNPQVKTIFTNYPVVDYELQCNMPLSHTTYQSLMPSLKKITGTLNTKDGVDFLLHFTRYAFLFKPDSEVYGGEKRLSPEQTLLYDYSDCEDRVALLFYLVKEIYNLPMIVLTYPKHVTVAVQFEKAYGKTIDYNGVKYSICEPSPQRYDLRIGQLLPELKHQAYEVAYAYKPFTAQQK